MKLLILNPITFRVTPTEHALMIEPFKTMWNSDTSENKKVSIDYFSYVELLCSPKLSNPYYAYSPKERATKVAEEIFGDANHPIDTDLIFAVAKYKELLENSSITYKTLQDSETLLNKTRDYLRDLVPGETTINGALVLKPKEILLASKELPSAVAVIEELRKKVNQELEESDVKTRNQREIGQYEE